MARLAWRIPRVAWLGWAGALALFLLQGCADEVEPATPVLAGQAGASGAGGEPTPPGDAGHPPDDPPPDDDGPGAAHDFPDPDWATGDPADYGLDAGKLDEAAAIAEGFDSYCLLVFRKGTLVFERYFQGHDASTPQKSFSIAKSYSSALVGIAVERGDIGSLDDSVASYIPEWQGTDREAITIRNVLSMTSGLEWSAFDDYFVMTVLSQNHSDHAKQLQKDKAPDSEWLYHNGGVQLLELVFRAATGATIEQYAAEHLWSRIGMSGVSWAHDPAGNPTTYASVMASCRDHARFGHLYRHGGKWHDEQVVPAEDVNMSLTPSQPFNRAYGLLWWLNAEEPAVDAMGNPWEGRMSPVAPPDMFAARGFGNQFIDVIPSLDMMVVRFGTDPMTNFDLQRLIEDQHFAKHDAILGAVLEAVNE